MRNIYVIGNWKMHGNRTQLAALTQGILASLTNLPSMVKVGICPPFVYLDHIHRLLSSAASPIELGAQDISSHEEGAYTGQVASNMLKDFGCHYTIVGHSERRHGCFETPMDIALKTKNVISNGVTPIVCVGETLSAREDGQAEQVIISQLTPILNLGEEYLSKIIIAYEPVWAIGTGKTASPEQAQEIHAFIRQEVAKRSQDVAQSLAILYGGSVKPDNALELFKCPDIDGGLIGGASLDEEAFIDICRFAFKAAETEAA
jgi:triosephosphate isomerase (TIM)